MCRLAVTRMSRCCDRLRLPDVVAPSSRSLRASARPVRRAGHPVRAAKPFISRLHSSLLTAVRCKGEDGERMSVLISCGT